MSPLQIITESNHPISIIKSYKIIMNIVSIKSCKAKTIGLNWNSSMNQQVYGLFWSCVWNRSSINDVIFTSGRYP